MVTADNHRILQSLAEGAPVRSNGGLQSVAEGASVRSNGGLQSVAEGASVRSNGGLQSVAGTAIAERRNPKLPEPPSLPDNE